MEKVRGHEIPSARMTKAALFVFMLKVGLPLIGLLLAIDFLLWAILSAFGKCYGVLCWF